MNRPIETSSADLARGFIREIEGLRAIAIVVVMVHRFWPRSGPLAETYGHVAELGWMGVDLFFVISGFLIAGILLDSKGGPAYFKNFYARRVLRIFPLYYAFVGLLLIAYPLTQSGAYFDTEFVQQAGSPLWYLFYLSNVPEMIGHDPPFVLAPVWSLAIEEQFYLVFPCAVALLSRRKLVIALAGAVAFAPIFRAVTVYVWPANERVQYLATPSRMDELALGCLVAVAFRTQWFAPKRSHVHWALLGAAVLFGIALLASGLDRTQTFGRIGGYSIVAFSLTVVVLWAVVNRESRLTWALRLGPVMYVGKLCYGLYLLHRPAAFLVDEALTRLSLPVATDGIVPVAIKLATALGLATVSWYAFEQPILRLKRHFQPSTERLGEVTAPLGNAS